MTALTFRPATIDDLPMIVVLKLEMFAEAGFAHLLANDAEQIILADYEQLYDGGLAQHFVAEQNRQLVAMVGAFVKSDVPYRYYKTPVYGFIGDVYTRPHYRQRKLAKHLSEQALGWLKTQGVETVRLLVADAARPMYEALGFKPSDEMVLHLQPGAE